jgi:hypothetical protein
MSMQLVVMVLTLEPGSKRTYVHTHSIQTVLHCGNSSRHFSTVPTQESCHRFAIPHRLLKLAAGLALETLYQLQIFCACTWIFMEELKGMHINLQICSSVNSAQCYILRGMPKNKLDILLKSSEKNVLWQSKWGRYATLKSLLCDKTEIKLKMKYWGMQHTNWKNTAMTGNGKGVNLYNPNKIQFSKNTGPIKYVWNAPAILKL